MDELETVAKPAGKKRRGRPFPKGRQVDPAALDAVRTLLGARPRRRDHLIEFLHLIQDSLGHLPATHLAALAEEMRLSQAEVFEVATFYHHFDVVKEGEAAPPAVTVRVCTSLTCALSGSEDLKTRLEATLDKDVRVLEAPCVGACDHAPVAVVGQRQIGLATLESVSGAIEKSTVREDVPQAESLDTYRVRGGYKTLSDVRDGSLTLDTLLETLTASGLRGLGGAGFPTGRKKGLVLGATGPRYVAVNADEGEPGTFKDRYWMERVPHQFLEGVLIAAAAIEAERAFIYLRDEYAGIRELLTREIALIESEGLAAPGYIELRRGAGAYICGEESAMIESIEGKRGLPRHRPPYVAEVGLFGRPTLVNNVETLTWVPEILRNGAAWFADQGKEGHKGPRSYSVSGRVKEPGVKIAPAGITVTELIEQHCGGMAEGHAFKAYLPGGASGGILPAAMGDLPLDFGTLEKHGCFVGSHAVVILSDRDDVGYAARNLLKFFEHESCGQCTPCRVGCEKAVQLMGAETWDTPLLEELAAAMTDASICGLGQAAPNPMLSVMRYFRDEVT